MCAWRATFPYQGLVRTCGGSAGQSHMVTDGWLCSLQHGEERHSRQCGRDLRLRSSAVVRVSAAWATRREPLINCLACALADVTAHVFQMWFSR